MEVTFNYKNDLYCVKDNIYIWMLTPMAMPLPKFPNDSPKIFFYYPLLRNQPLGDVVKYRSSENLKKQQQSTKNQGKILDKYLWRNSFLFLHIYFQEFCPDLKYTSRGHPSMTPLRDTSWWLLWLLADVFSYVSTRYKNVMHYQRKNI